MTEYKDGLKAFSSRSNPNDPFHVYGWGAAQTMVEALKNMKEPTRDALMDSVRNLDQEVPILLPGIKVETTPDDGYALEAMQVQRFDGKRWRLVGDVVESER
jgi:branched-chain amino acid transport system substrate-binding protein